jgi:prepilin-type N-terminal cleavage/methylation domain-containing protein
MNENGKIRNLKSQTPNGEECTDGQAGEHVQNPSCDEIPMFGIWDFGFGISCLRSGYTMIEMLVVMAILTLVMTGAIGFFHEGFAACRTAIRQSQEQQELSVVKRQWRAVVHRGVGPVSLVDNQLRFANQTLSLRSGGVSVSGEFGEKVIPLSRHAGAEFQMEPADGQAVDRIVLRFRLSDGGERRIVACLVPATNATTINWRTGPLHRKTELGLGGPRHAASLNSRPVFVPLVPATSVGAP